MRQNRLPADLDARGINDGIFWMRFPARQLIALLNAEDALDLRQSGKRLEIGMGAFVPNGRHHCLRNTIDRRGRIAEFLNFGDDFCDLFF